MLKTVLFLEFSIVLSTMLWYWVFFPLGGYVYEVVDSRVNYQEYKYVYLFWCHAFAVMHSVNGEGFVTLSKELFLMCTV